MHAMNGRFSPLTVRSNLASALGSITEVHCGPVVRRAARTDRNRCQPASLPTLNNLWSPSPARVWEDHKAACIKGTRWLNWPEALTKASLPKTRVREWLPASAINGALRESTENWPPPATPRKHWAQKDKRPPLAWEPCLTGGVRGIRTLDEALHPILP